MLRAMHLTACLGFVLTVCLAPAASEARSSSHRLSSAPPQEQTGVASFYCDELQGHRTASGRRFDNRRFTAASLTLPINSRAEVTSLKTGLSVTVTITDRGPFAKARVIDLSKAAAEEIGISAREGIGMVLIRPLPPSVAVTRDRRLSSL
jgi:rare lipoprotein A